MKIISAKMNVGAVRSAPKSATAQVVPPVPNPMVAGAQALIQSNCQSPEPALIARITIKNLGGPLAAGKGTLIVSGSPGLYGTLVLPQMNMGETKSLDVPVPSTTPHSKLPGNHPMNVYLEPYKGQNGLPNFGKPSAPYPFTAVFPTGHCVHRSLPPAGAVKSLPNPPNAPRCAEVNLHAGARTDVPSFGPLSSLRSQDD